MRNKRIIVTVAMFLSMCGSITALAAAKSNTYKYNSTSNVYGYIDFLEGPLTIEDRVYYTASIGGSDISKCTVAYKVIVDNSIKVSGVLKKSNPTASESGLKVGHGHEYAKLQLDFNGNTKVLTSYAD